MIGYASFKCTECKQTYSTRFLWDEDEVWLCAEIANATTALQANIDPRGTESREGLCVWCEDDEQPHEADIGMIEDDDG